MLDLQAAVAVSAVAAPAVSPTSPAPATATTPPIAAPVATPLPVPPNGFIAYAGTATARRSPKLLYREEDVLRYQGGRLAERVVLYACADGTPFARKTVLYVDPLSPDFDLDDVSNGMREGIRQAASGRRVYFQLGNGPEKSGPLPPVAGLVADAGFDEFVHEHWDELLADRTLSLRFLVPSRLEAIGFQVQRLRADRLDGVPVQVFRLKLSGFWGWILPGIDVSYGAAERVLMRYDGLSDLRDASNDNFQTVVTFHARDRRAADADELPVASDLSSRAPRPAGNVPPLH
jgi:hypothetical protein